MNSWDRFGPWRPLVDQFSGGGTAPPTPSSWLPGALFDMPPAPLSWPDLSAPPAPDLSSPPRASDNTVTWMGLPVPDRRRDPDEFSLLGLIPQPRREREAAPTGSMQPPSDSLIPPPTPLSPLDWLWSVAPNMGCRTEYMESVGRRTVAAAAKPAGHAGQDPVEWRPADRRRRGRRSRTRAQCLAGATDAPAVNA